MTRTNKKVYIIFMVQANIRRGSSAYETAEKSVVPQICLWLQKTEFPAVNFFTANFWVVNFLTADLFRGDENKPWDDLEKIRSTAEISAVL